MVGMSSRTTNKVTLGVQGVVVDDRSRVLLIRHGYRPGWHFPGGGVERGESLLTALAREMDEEAGVIVEEVRLIGIYTNFEAFRGDHIVLYAIERWHQDRIPKPSTEIAEQRFFALAELPDGISPGTERRLDELYRGATKLPSW